MLAIVFRLHITSISFVLYKDTRKCSNLKHKMFGYLTIWNFSGTNVIFKSLRQICWLISGHPASSSFYHQFLGIVTLSNNKHTGVWSIKRLHSWNIKKQPKTHIMLGISFTPEIVTENSDMKIFYRKILIHKIKIFIPIIIDSSSVNIFADWYWNLCLISQENNSSWT